MNYLKAEHLKHKRTFTRKLIILAPLVTAIMNIFAPLWYQINSYNWWYILLYPGFLTLICVLVEQRDNGKLKYRSILSLPVSLNRVCSAKIEIASIYVVLGNLIFLMLNILGGFGILTIYKIPFTIDIWQAVSGTICIVITSLWEIPLCLMLSKKVGIFITVILNVGAGSVLGTFVANTFLWIICPYSWVPHLMISVLGILPNGEPVANQGITMSFLTIILMLCISLLLFVILSYVAGRCFNKQEERT